MGHSHRWGGTKDPSGNLRQEKVVQEGSVDARGGYLETAENANVVRKEPIWWLNEKKRKRKESNSARSFMFKIIVT